MEKNVKQGLILIGILSCLMFGGIMYALNAKSEHKGASINKSKTVRNSTSKATTPTDNLTRSEKRLFDGEDKDKRDSIVTFAKSLLGIPYRYAQSTPDGFDCSGFIYYVYSKFNVKISRSSYTIAEEGVDVDSSDAQKGDLIFFRGTDIDDPKIGHIGIIISEKDEPIEFIHSSSSKKNNGVVITKLNSSHYKERYVKIKNVL
jgi:cell wall-associated NlpC family hydrolase